MDFGLSSSNLDASARSAWPYDFGLIYSVTLSQEGLETSMLVRNEGTEPWEFQVLMHTYLRISVGLTNCCYEAVERLMVLIGY
jgi:glucose-6-phosphate 1-epimerase